MVTLRAYLKLASTLHFNVLGFGGSQLSLLLILSLFVELLCFSFTWAHSWKNSSPLLTTSKFVTTLLFHNISFLLRQLLHNNIVTLLPLVLTQLLENLKIRLDKLSTSRIGLLIACDRPSLSQHPSFLVQSIKIWNVFSIWLSKRGHNVEHSTPRDYNFILIGRQ